MSLQIAFAALLAAGAATDPALCSGTQSRIEPDMRILESDLGKQAAIAAADRLRGMIDRGDLDGDFRFAVSNQLKIIQGHALLQHAHSDRNAFGPNSPEARDSTRALCDWLATDGFWHD